MAKLYPTQPWKPILLQTWVQVHFQLWISVQGGWRLISFSPSGFLAPRLELGMLSGYLLKE